MTTRKQKTAELTAPDPFEVGARKVADWVERNGKLIILVVVGAAVAVTGGILLQKHGRRSASEVTSKLVVALDDYRDAVDPQEAMTATTTAVLEEKWKKALPPFEAVIEQHADHSAANLARLYAADLQRRLGNHAQAESLYKAYIEAAKPDDIALFLAIEGAGYAAEDQKKYDEALAQFEKLRDHPSTAFYKDYAYKHIGRIQELKGDKAKALEAYKKLRDEYPESKLHDFAEQRVAALE